MNVTITFEASNATVQDTTALATALAGLRDAIPTGAKPLLCNLENAVETLCDRIKHDHSRTLQSRGLA